jgi:hypothetical protein
LPEQKGGFAQHVEIAFPASHFRWVVERVVLAVGNPCHFGGPWESVDHNQMLVSAKPLQQSADPYCPSLK